MPRSTITKTLRLTPQELAGLKERAGELGLSTNALLVKMVREVLGATPELLNDDVQALADANAQVHAVGRNLNQLVRAVNGGRGKGVHIDHAYLGVIAETVSVTLAEIQKLAQRQRERWVFLDGDNA